MWTVNVVNKDNYLADVTANFTDPETTFSWSSTIKLNETDEFIKRAKKELKNHQNLHKNENSLKLSLEQGLNS